MRECEIPSSLRACYQGGDSTDLMMIRLVGSHVLTQQLIPSRSVSRSDPQSTLLLRRSLKELPRYTQRFFKVGDDGADACDVEETELNDGVVDARCGRLTCFGGGREEEGGQVDDGECRRCHAD